MLLEIKDLHVSVKNKPILKGINLEIKPGEIHAVMGPNGAGKSTLAKVLSGHPDFEITKGTIHFKDEDLLSMEPEIRAQKGLFMSFQYPIEIPGVSNLDFLFTSYNAIKKANDKDPATEPEFEKFLDEKMKLLEMDPSFKTRHLNDGFSGGEKKRNEILQMAILNPKVAILDETDSGLDIDAIQIVAKGVNKIMNKDMAIVLITHYQRLLNFIKPNFVHVMQDGKIVKSGGPDLAHELEEKGYETI